jgi:hypothetical protein
MTPNIAFEKLDESSLYAYQQLLRKVGIGEVWEKGNRALAALLGISYGRIPGLKAVLKKEGFIRLIPGDAAHGAPDKWHVLDVFDYKENTLSENEQATLSENIQGLSENEQGQVSDTATLSENEQGQEPANTGISEENAPCQKTNNPLSENEQATLSENEQHLNKIFLKEDLKDLFKRERETRAPALDVIQIFQKYFPERELSEFQQKAFKRQVKNLAIWKLAVEYFALGGWKSIPKLLEKYDELVIQTAYAPPSANGHCDDAAGDVFDSGEAVGMSVEQANEFFESVGYSMRIVKINGEPVETAGDYDEARINVSVKGEEIIEVLNVG